MARVTKKKKKVDIDNLPSCPYDNVSQELIIREEQAQSLLKEEGGTVNYANMAQMVSQEIFFPLSYYDDYAQKKERSAEDLQNVFDCFKRILREVQKYVAYTPTICTFLQFANLCDRTFRNYLDMNNALGDVANRIKNFLSEQTIQGVWGGTTKEISGIFAMKSMYGFRENEQPQTNIVNINSQDRSVEEILAEFNKIAKK